MKTSKDPFVPNPILGGSFGVFLLAAAAHNLSNGFFVGLGVAVSSIILSSLLPAVRAVAPERLRAPIALSFAAALALLYANLVTTLAPSTAAGLGVYLPLLAVNCLNLHVLRNLQLPPLRGEPMATRFGTVVRQASAYLLIALVIGGIREAAGQGSLVIPAIFAGGGKILLTEEAPMQILASPAGGLVLIGCAAALYRFFLRRTGRRIS